MTVVLAPAKLNLCLYLGPRREDGLHELCSLFEPLSLADRIEVGDAESDAVVCEGFDGENLAALALEGLRRQGWGAAPKRIEIRKRIPVAAGLGGGSADAAAVLRLAGEAAGAIDELALELGADVPSQLDPRFALVRGAGERVEPLPNPGGHAFALLPAEAGLATAAVYAEADRLELSRSAAELERVATRLREATGAGASPLAYTDLLLNDLEAAALSLRPEMGVALGALRDAGAAKALITGSGPTAFGLFADVAEAEETVAAMRAEWPGAVACAPGRGG
jgi:4-diphosphocytidyl-2-C-methyl-D-erythritol kinase